MRGPDVVAALAEHTRRSRARSSPSREEELYSKSWCMRDAAIWPEQHYNAWYREAGRKVDPCGVGHKDETEFYQSTAFHKETTCEVEARTLLDTSRMWSNLYAIK